MLRVLDVDFVSECILEINLFEAWQDYFQRAFNRLSGLCLEMIINNCRSTFSYSFQRVSPDQLFAHAYYDGSLAFSHGLRTERVGNLQNAQRPDVELAPLQQKCEYPRVVCLHGHINIRGLSERVLERQHR